MVDKAPKVTLYRELKRWVRWLKSEEVEALLGSRTEHQADLMRFAISTGMRQGIGAVQVLMHGLSFAHLRNAG